MVDKTLEEVKRGEQAAVILDNPIYQDRKSTRLNSSHT